jgi:hypothetical protein
MIGISVCLNSNAGAAVVVVDDEAATAGFATAGADGAFAFGVVAEAAGGGTTSVELLQSSIKAKQCHYQVAIALAERSVDVDGVGDSDGGTYGATRWKGRGTALGVGGWAVMADCIAWITSCTLLFATTTTNNQRHRMSHQ